MAISTYTKTGAKSTQAVKLDKAVFGEMPKDHELIKSAYLAYMANGRDNLAQVKTRGLVRGGGKKPWRQKGTGRARFGSSRNPIWRGGGVAFGPTGEENYKSNIHKTAKRKAIRQALSLAADTGKLIVIEDFVVKSNKTSEAAKLLAKINADRRVLVAVSEKSEELKLAVRNLKDVNLVQARYLNVFDIINADSIVITNGALAILSDWLGSKEQTKSVKGEA